ncbi:hypothetical protein MuYL_2789 [Mucilaginibacter xinganensis]|uniref:Uncharacterized protein n=1 Tax=Mucilaginibacter xinganensis TaxID=1234841 RepID=A0A223NXX8_9SPHI|nr:hypothetical protein MuYL_2789 [Mucilaginibacter xinganensis]
MIKFKVTEQALKFTLIVFIFLPRYCFPALSSYHENYKVGNFRCR